MQGYFRCMDNYGPSVNQGIQKKSVKLLRKNLQTTTKLLQKFKTRTKEKEKKEKANNYSREWASQKLHFLTPRKNKQRKEG